ncbi:plasmid partition protein ParG [Telmatobacter sp. DSM 110680]|uniref:Plasmid partition protein ParG n=1 Tax=Telmatobacter sp. DSM 110680 TaxID=3036704 RepID=A0AAU7DN06_9BACT
MSSIAKIIEEEIKRLNMNLTVSLHNAFKAATAARGENMTDVLMAYIKAYVEKNSTKGRRR